MDKSYSRVTVGMLNRIPPAANEGGVVLAAADDSPQGSVGLLQ